MFMLESNETLLGQGWSQVKKWKSSGLLRQLLLLPKWATLGPLCATPGSYKTQPFTKYFIAQGGVAQLVGSRPSDQWFEPCYGWYVEVSLGKTLLVWWKFVLCSLFSSCPLCFLCRCGEQDATRGERWTARRHVRAVPLGEHQLGLPETYWQGSPENRWTAWSWLHCQSKSFSWKVEFFSSVWTLVIVTLLTPVQQVFIIYIIYCTYWSESAQWHLFKRLNPGAFRLVPPTGISHVELTDQLMLQGDFLLYSPQLNSKLWF